MASSEKSNKILFQIYLKINELAKTGSNSLKISHELSLPQFIILEALLSEFSIFEERISNKIPKHIQEKILKKIQPSIKKKLKRKRSPRDNQIIEYRKQGLTLEEIGKLTGVTRERVRQIIKSLDVEKELDQAIRDRQNAILLKDKEESIRIFHLISDNWDTYKLKSLQSIAIEFDISVAKLSKCISRIQYVYLKANQEYSISKFWTDAQCLESLINAATFEFPLTVARYQQLLNEKTIEGPTVAIFVQRFGSWVNACTLAGVEYGETQRQYNRTWNDTELLRFVRRFLYEREDGRWSIEMYEMWRKLPEVAGPSVALLRNYLGSWSEIRVLALELSAPEFDMQKFSDLGSNEY